MRIQGRVAEWRDEKGFGFITPEQGGERVFVHIKSFIGLPRRPTLNDKISFELGADSRGRPRAVRAELLAEAAHRHASKSSATYLVFFACLYIVAVGVLAASGKVAFLYLYGYCGLSVLAFGFYAVDKSAAAEGRWRVQESTLQLLALAGGWPGALVAQQLLRHKSKKRSFLWVFWLTVLGNVAVFSLLCSSSAENILASVLGGKG